MWVYIRRTVVSATHQVAFAIAIPLAMSLTLGALVVLTVHPIIQFSRPAAILARGYSGVVVLAVVTATYQFSVAF